MVVEGADVANKGGGIHDGSDSFSQNVISIGVRYFFLFEATPLVNQVVVAIVTNLEVEEQAWLRPQNSNL